MSENATTILSLNVRGLNDKRKRLAIFEQLRDENPSIVLLQETYCAISEEKCWLDDWGGEGIFSHGSKHSAGVALLFRKNF